MAERLDVVLREDGNYFESEAEENEFLDFCEKNELDISKFYIYENSALGNRFADYMDFSNMVFINIFVLSVEFLKMSHFLESIKIQKELWDNKEYKRWIFLTHRRFYANILKSFSFDKNSIPDDELWEMFRYLWIDAEYLNGIVSRDTLLSYFNLNQDIDEDLKKLKTKDSYNDGKIMIYRGESSKSNSYKTALSWTLSKEKAIWFANRFKADNPVVYEAEVSLEDILAYFDSRGEDEVIVDYKKSKFKVKKIKDMV